MVGQNVISYVLDIIRELWTTRPLGRTVRGTNYVSKAIFCRATVCLILCTADRLGLKGRTAHMSFYSSSDRTLNAKLVVDF